MRKNYNFYSSVENIAGWLNQPAALRTMDILTWQEENKNHGGLLEIGVFCGKYFALLLDSARRTSDPILGIDTFQFAPPERVVKEMYGAFGEDVSGSFTLWKMRSDAVLAREIEAQIGRCRFISIDGAHDHQSVYLDLVLAENILSTSGIVAVDDFLNPVAIGVNQAVNTYFSQPRPLEPVAYIANKLFLSHRVFADEARVEIEKMFSSGQDPQSENFNKRKKNGRHHIEQEFYGNRILIG